MSQTEAYDSGNPEHVRAEKSKAKQDEARRKSDLRAVWSTEAGRRVMWDLLGRCGVHHVSYKLGGNTTDAIFREGMRNIGLSIEADVLLACPDLYFLAQQEASVKNQKEKKADE